MDSLMASLNICLEKSSCRGERADGGKLLLESIHKSECCFHFMFNHNYNITDGSWWNSAPKCSFGYNCADVEAAKNET